MAEHYPSFVKINDGNEVVELPTEKDGTMLLSSVSSQFPEALGLRFKSESGSWRGVSLSGDNILLTPSGGWGSIEYHAVLPKRVEKRKVVHDDDDFSDEDESPLDKISRMTPKEILSDLVLLNLPFSTTEEDLKSHFSKYGEVKAVEIKRDSHGESRGFGFLSYKTIEAVKSCLSETHTLEGRTLNVTYPKRKEDREVELPMKLFVGRLPAGATTDEVNEYFSEFGEIKDTYLPSPFRGYGFVTFKKKSVVRKVLNCTHRLRGKYLNVNVPQTEKERNVHHDGQWPGPRPYQSAPPMRKDFDNHQMQMPIPIQDYRSLAINSGAHGNQEKDNSQGVGNMAAIFSFFSNAMSSNPNMFSGDHNKGSAGGNYYWSGSKGN